MNLEFTDSRQSGQQTPGILLFLPPKCWGDRGLDLRGFCEDSVSMLTQQAPKLLTLLPLLDHNQSLALKKGPGG